MALNTMSKNANEKCLCGKVATHTAWLPMSNIFAKTKQVMEGHNVCEFHAIRAEYHGYHVEVKVKV